MSALHEKRIEILRRVLSDVIIIGSGGITLVLFRFLGDPYKRGFFCDDESLKHPFKESTVNSSVLYVVGFALGTVLIGVTEFLWIYCVKKRDTQQTVDINKYGKHWILIRDIYLSLVPYVFGAALEHVITDIGKYSIGRLRPHFFEVCKVDYRKVNCSAGYIEEFECMGANENRIREMRLSFPSGHASFSSYCAVYLMIFLQRRLTFLFNSLIRPLLQTIIFVMAYYTCLSRVSDYKHHPTDVIAGAVIGSGVAVLVAYCVSDLFNMADQRETYREMYSNMKIESSGNGNSDSDKMSENDARM